MPILKNLGSSCHLEVTTQNLELESMPPEMTTNFPYIVRVMGIQFKDVTVKLPPSPYCHWDTPPPPPAFPNQPASLKPKVISRPEGSDRATHFMRFLNMLQPV